MKTEERPIWIKTNPRTWYKRLDKYPQQQGFKKGTIGSNLYVMSKGNHLLIVVVYVDDIIFCDDMKQLGHQFQNVSKQNLKCLLSLPETTLDCLQD